MRGRASLLAAVAVIAAPGVAQQTAPATTVQQDFEAATRLQDKGDVAAALPLWQALERRTSKNPRSLALVRLRMGATLFALGRRDEAAAATRTGLVTLSASDPSLRGDRFTAFLMLGNIAEASLDYASAAAAYTDAEKLAGEPFGKLAALRGLIQTATFVDPAAAARSVIAADAVVAGVKTDASVRATIRRLNGQLLLNQGAFAASRGESGEAVKLLGGLTERTELDDVSVRSNYAIAALLEGKLDVARQYMAMTGAGRLTKGSFNPALQMRMPECGGETGLKPADVAVIEFTIDDDGVVRNSVPVYAAGGGQVALEFARAARSWSWTPEQVAPMPAFFRNRARVELRCSIEFTRPSTSDFLDGELGSWLTRRAVKMPELLTGSDAMILPQLRAQLTQVEAAGGPDQLALVPILHQLVRNVVVPGPDRLGYARRELAIATANDVTPPARLAIESVIWANDKTEKWRDDSYGKLLNGHLADAPYAGDPVARSALRLMAADATYRNVTTERALLTAVGADAGLAANHPLKVGALVRLASLEQGAGNGVAAAAAFEQSGLSARQCALVDSAPRGLGINAGSNSFPMEALRWGFEGWARTQFDVTAQGAVDKQRVITAYPPFVFSTASTMVMKSARYEKTFRPDGGVGCGGASQTVRFKLGG